MRVKEKIGRKRYIVFQITIGDFRKDDLEKMIFLYARRKFKNFKNLKLNLIKFDGEFGILRCSWKYKNDTIEFLNSMTKIKGKDVDLRTIKTTGTIKKAKKIIRDICERRHIRRMRDAHGGCTTSQKRPGAH